MFIPSMDISISCAQLCRSELPKAGLGIVDVGPRQIPTPPGGAFLFCGPENKLFIQWEFQVLKIGELTP